MMLDDDIVAVSPSATYRVLKNAGRLDRRVVTPSKKGTGLSRYIVHWELRETMKEFDIELVIAKGIEKHPGVKP